MGGRGSLRERRPGVWELRVFVGRDPFTNKEVSLSRTFRGTKNEAVNELTRLAAEHDRQPADKVTFAAHTKEWLAHRRDISPTTRRRYQGLLRLWINPAVGEVQLGKLTAYQLDRLYAHMAEKGQSTSSINQAHWLISGSLEQAVRWERVRRNVADRATKPPRRSAERPIPTDDEVRRVLAEAQKTDPAMAALIWVAAASGARRGELAALQWRHVGWERRTLRIDQAVVNTGSGRPGAKARGTQRSVVVKDTKTHQRRLLSLDDGTMAILADHLTRAEKTAAEFGVTIEPDAFVFSHDPDGAQPINPDTMTHDLTEIREAADVGYFTLQGLRRWMVTTGLADGEDVRTMAGRAGHRPDVAMRIYAGFLSARDAAIAERVGRALSGPSEGPDQPPESHHGGDGPEEQG